MRYIIALLLSFLASYGYADAASVTAYCNSQFPLQSSNGITPQNSRNCAAAIIANAGSLAPVVSATLIGNGNSVTVQLSGATISTTLLKRFTASVDPYFDTGAVGDGVTDDYAALVRAYNLVPANGLLRITKPLFIASNTFIVSKTIGIAFDPAGAIYVNPGFSALKITSPTATGVNVYNVNVAGVNNVTRTDIPLVWVNAGASKVNFYGGLNNNSSGAGFLFANVNGFLVQGVEVSGSLADGFAAHNEEDAPRNGIFANNTSRNTGDDGFSCVQYTTGGKAGVNTNIQYIGNRSLGSNAANMTIAGCENILVSSFQGISASGPYAFRAEQDSAYGTGTVKKLTVRGLQIEGAAQSGGLIGAGVVDSIIDGQVSGTGSRGWFIGSNTTTSQSQNIQATLSAINAGTQGIETNGVNGLTGTLSSVSATGHGLVFSANSSNLDLTTYAKNNGYGTPGTFYDTFLNGVRGGRFRSTNIETSTTNVAVNLMRLTNVSDVTVLSAMNLRNGVPERIAQDTGGGAVSSTYYPIQNTSRDTGGVSVSFIQGNGNNVTVNITSTVAGASLTSILTSSGTVLPAVLMGADATGVSDSYNAVQNAHDQLLNRMLSQTTNVPSGAQTFQSGNYRFDTGLKRYTPIGLYSQGGAVNLNFANMPSTSVAVSVSSLGFTSSNTMLPGQGFAQQGDALNGINGVINISGSALSASSTGLYVGNVVSSGLVGQNTALTRIENVRVDGFGNNLWLGGYNTYINLFDKYNSRNPYYAHILVQDDTDGTDNNSGENVRFTNCTLSGGILSSSIPMIRYRSQARNITMQGCSGDYIHGALVQIDDIGAGAMGYTYTQLLDGHYENQDYDYLGLAPNITNAFLRIDGNRLFPGQYYGDGSTPRAPSMMGDGSATITFTNNNIGRWTYNDSRVASMYRYSSRTTVGEIASNYYDEDRQLFHPSLNPLYGSQFEASVSGTDIRYGSTPGWTFGNQTATVSMTIVDYGGNPYMLGTKALRFTGLGFTVAYTDPFPVKQTQQMMFQGLYNGLDTTTGAFDNTSTVECLQPVPVQTIPVTSFSKSGRDLTVNMLVSNSSLIQHAMVTIRGVSPTYYANRYFPVFTDSSNTLALALRVNPDQVTPAPLVSTVSASVEVWGYRPVGSTTYSLTNISSTYADSANLGYDGTRNYPIHVGPMDAVSGASRDISLKSPGCQYARIISTIDSGANSTASASSTLFYGYAINTW